MNRHHLDCQRGTNESVSIVLQNLNLWLFQTSSFTFRDKTVSMTPFNPFMHHVPRALMNHEFMIKWTHGVSCSSLECRMIGWKSIIARNLPAPQMGQSALQSRTYCMDNLFLTASTPHAFHFIRADFHSFLYRKSYEKVGYDSRSRARMIASQSPLLTLYWLVQFRTWL